MKELAINIHSDIFADMRNDIDKHLKHCLDELSQENFEGGDISIKISLETIKATDELKKLDREGKFEGVEVEYKIPSIAYKTSLTLKQKHDTEGRYFDRGMQLVEMDGRYVALPVKGSQICLNDLLGDSEQASD